jgi:hypothetical protein
MENISLNLIYGDSIREYIDMNSTYVLSDSINAMKMFDEPLNFVKNPNEMGITERSDLSNNILGLIHYNNALYSGKVDGGATAYKQPDGGNLDTNNQPLGNRYFLPAYGLCTPNNGGEPVDRYYPIDNMAYNKNEDGTLDILSTGLLYSAKGSLNSVNSDITDGKADTCVLVSMSKDSTGKNIESQYVSIDDYNKMQYTAFKNNCKTYNGKQGGCEKEGFETISNTKYDYISMSVTDFYIASISILGLYILYCLVEKRK